MNVAQQVEYVAAALDRSDVSFGHGTDNAWDEAAWLVLHVMGAPLDGSFDHWERELSVAEASGITALLNQRISRKMPLAYLTGVMRFAGIEFETSPDTLVPRSPIAELIFEQFQPWVKPERIKQVLDLCTGSGCIAAAIAVHMPWTQVTASDISAEALAVASRNVERHALEGRVHLVESDLFQSLAGNRFDLIVSNPPYVPEDEIGSLPGEFRAEPELGLVSGDDGLNACLEILSVSADFLMPEGVLICEVGESESALQDLLHEVPFIWLEFSAGGSGVFVMTREQLCKARPLIKEILEKRKHVT